MDNYSFSKVIDIIKKDDVKTLLELEKFIDLKQKNINEDTLLHCSCLLNSHKCTLFLLDKIDPLSKNINNHSPVDLLQLKYENFKDNDSYKKILNKIKNNIKTRKIENIICNKIFSCLKFNLYNEIEFLLDLIDVKSNDKIMYFSKEQNKILSHNFVYLAYQYDDKIFYQMLTERGLILNKNAMEDLKKIALFEVKYDWHSLLSKNTFYDHNSKESILMSSVFIQFAI